MNALVTRLRRSLQTLNGRGQNGGDALVPARPPLPMIYEAIPFQDAIDEITEERPPRFMRSIHYLVVGLFLSLLLIASLVKVDIVVTSTGRLETDTPPIMLQPMERAMIREMHVTIGQSVTKGQVLATLDPTFAKADLMSLSAQDRSLLAQIHRLEAELNNRPFDPGPAANSDDLLQLTLYRQRHANYDSRVRGFDEEILRLQSDIRGAEEDRQLLSRQVEVARDVERMRQSLMESQTGSKLQLLDAQSMRMRAEKDLQNAASRADQLRHAVQSKQAERQAFIDDWRRQLMENLVSARTESSKVGEGLTKASRLNDLVVLTAPEDGVVLDIAQRSVGSVLREAEPLITLIPNNAALIADIQINSADVGYTKAGDEVVIKVDAFPYQRHGFLKGRLKSVSEDSFNNGPSRGSRPDSMEQALAPTPTAVHRGRVELLGTTLEHMPEGAHLIPGMTLNADIKVGSRAIISYFLYPITRALSESVREP